MTAVPVARRLHRAGAAVAARINGYPPALSAAFVGLILFAIYLPTASHSFNQSPDPLAALIPAWEVANHGTLTLDHHEDLVVWFREFDGRILSNRAPGVIFFGVPFYWALQGLGQSPLPAAVAGAFAAANAMAVLHLVFRRHTTPATAFAGALVAGLATATWTVSADGLWPHGPAQLFIALALLAAPRRTWLSGVFLGLAILTRPQVAVAALVFGCAWGLQSRSLWPVVRVGIGSAAGALGLVAYNTMVLAAPAVTGGYGDMPLNHLSTFTAASYGLKVLGTLVSPDRGVLFMSPFLIVLALGIAAAWRRSSPEIRAASLAGAAYIAVYLTLNRFSGGENFFSYRLPIEALTLAAPLLLLAYQHWVAPRRWALATFWPLVVAAVAVHALGAAYYAPSYESHGPWHGARFAEAAVGAGPVATATIAVLATALAIAAGAWANVAVGLRGATRTADTSEPASRPPRTGD